METMNTLEDRDLAARIAGGDATAERDLVELYSRPLLQMLLRLTRDAALSEDFHQDTFRIVIARLRRSSLSEPDKLLRFVLRTGRNLALDYRRRQTRHREGPSPEESLPDPAQGQLDRMLQHEEAATVHRLLSEIVPDRYRQILQRFYLAGEDKDRICADLGLGDLHFNRVLFRARRRLRELALRAELNREVR
jgi:RNA polymerase sigma-70 factor, ECF subfamily